MKDKRVMVYRNLHYKKDVVWSGKSLSLGQVMFHKTFVYLKGGVKLKVSKAGRNRVLQDRKKNVHAGVVGIVARDDDGMALSGWLKVKYNPYKYESFVLADTEQPIYEAKEAYINEEGVFVRL
jgi:hypothetical protein